MTVKGKAYEGVLENLVGGSGVSGNQLDGRVGQGRGGLHPVKGLEAVGSKDFSQKEDHC